MKRFFLFLFFLIFSACSAQPIHLVPPTAIVQLTATMPAVPTATIISALPIPTQSPVPSHTAQPTLALPEPPLAETRDAADWQNWPVVPVATGSAREIYRRGLALGKQDNAFMKIGDCETYSTWFLTDFETANYTLGRENESLSGVIKQFQGSYSRLSVAAKAGFNTAAVISPFWADPKACEAGETPLICEVRIMQPSFALLTLGSNDVWQPEKFEDNYRLILEELIAEGVVPILATKADNVEGDHTINQTIARLAVEYDLPVWNFWLAVKDIPDGGLQEDGVHLTWAPNRFDDPLIMENAWPVRNLTALQVLDSIWRGVQE